VEAAQDALTAWPPHPRPSAAAPTRHVMTSTNYRGLTPRADGSIVVGSAMRRVGVWHRRHDAPDRRRCAGLDLESVGP
jgi:hypothetical protein